MTHSTGSGDCVDELLARLVTLHEADGGPFPYPGCRWLVAISPLRYRGLIPDLDVYLSEFAGYRSWGAKILTWPDEKIATVLPRLDRSFFDVFPDYAELEARLAEPEAADVRRDLAAMDDTRDVLRRLLTIIRASRAATPAE